jgi:hypothetical protein
LKKLALVQVQNRAQPKKTCTRDLKPCAGNSDFWQPLTND